MPAGQALRSEAGFVFADASVILQTNERAASVDVEPFSRRRSPDRWSAALEVRVHVDSASDGASHISIKRIGAIDARDGPGQTGERLGVEPLWRSSIPGDESAGWQVSSAALDLLPEFEGIYRAPTENGSLFLGVRGTRRVT